MSATPETSSDLPKSILILGAAKSGTTALYYAIRNTLINHHGVSVQGLHEPASPDVVRDYLFEKKDPLPLVKALLGPAMRWKRDISPDFEKRIVIYRDPRDNVVSRIVFMLTKMVDIKDKDKIAALVALFEKKEQDPKSISILQMLAEIENITGREDLPSWMRGNALLPAKLMKERGDFFFMLPYQDFVAGEFANLNTYMGMTIDPQFEVEGKHSYVTRTKGAGDWKNWFLDEDVQFFAKDVAEEFALLGYDPDEAPSESPSIPPEICSKYVTKQFDWMREKRKARKDKRRAEPGVVVAE